MADWGQGCSIGANRALIEAVPASLQALQTAEPHGTKYHWGRWSVMAGGHPFRSRWEGRAERGEDVRLQGLLNLGMTHCCAELSSRGTRRSWGLGTFGVSAAAEPSSQSTPKRAHSGTMLKVPWTQGQRQDAEAKLTGAGRFQVEQKNCQRVKRGPEDLKPWSPLALRSGAWWRGGDSGVVDACLSHHDTLLAFT
jgi:hypothetical protein